MTHSIVNADRLKRKLELGLQSCWGCIHPDYENLGQITNRLLASWIFPDNCWIQLSTGDLKEEKSRHRHKQEADICADGRLLLCRSRVNVVPMGTLPVVYVENRYCAYSSIFRKFGELRVKTAAVVRLLPGGSAACCGKASGLQTKPSQSPAAAPKQQFTYVKIETT
jgi:hypothetical protein